MVALCPNSSVVQIWGVNPSQPGKADLLHELHEHDSVVTGIDWGVNTNRIVTVSHDRNAYVWNFTEKDGAWVWVPTLVILRIHRAATAVSWNSTETKFAVASGAKWVAVCYFEHKDNWWVSKIIKKHRSTVLGVDWHPTFPILASGSSDFKCRVFSAYVKGVDAAESATSHPYGESKLGCGDVIAEFPCHGWVHAVKWSPSGKYLAFAGHGSTLHFVNFQGPNSPVQVIKMRGLPFRAIQFLSDSVLVAAGYELNPCMFVEQNGTWSFAGKVDNEVKEEAKKSSGVKATFEAFQKQAKTAAGAESVDLPTKHQNAISCICPLTAGGDVTQFSTSALDGIIACWNVQSIEQALANLKIDK
eukprot:c45416_g1_i1.p1 GENE.c45416_g1_i1~~c45416_g1_i1.p1  ORF type:complete len:393 (+),score=56.86 c45416_g1_i1:105-1181(+)